MQDNQKFRQTVGQVSSEISKKARDYLYNSKDPLYEDVRVLNGAIRAEELNKTTKSKREYDLPRAKIALWRIQQDLSQRSITPGDPLDLLRGELAKATLQEDTIFQRDSSLLDQVAKTTERGSKEKDREIIQNNIQDQMHYSNEFDIKAFWTFIKERQVKDKDGNTITIAYDKIQPEKMGRVQEIRKSIGKLHQQCNGPGDIKDHYEKIVRRLDELLRSHMINPYARHPEPDWEDDSTAAPLDTNLALQQAIDLMKKKDVKRMNGKVKGRIEAYAEEIIQMMSSHQEIKSIPDEYKEQN